MTWIRRMGVAKEDAPALDGVDAGGATLILRPRSSVERAAVS
jgi:hypothetical protein